MEGENYMKKRGRVLILLITAALAIEPLQLVYAEPAVDNLTGTVSQETGAEIRDENESAQPEPKPGWVSVEKGYQWRQEDGSFLQQSGWVTIQGKKYYLQKGGIRYSGWQTFKQKKRYYLSNGVLASKRWVKDNGQFYYIRKNGTPVPAGRWLTVKGRKYYIGKKGYRVLPPARTLPHPARSARPPEAFLPLPVHLQSTPRRTKALRKQEAACLYDCQIPAG